ncbi:MAG TPA: hypothetical protein VG713_17640, partial [Pirellulales bacterium]|nr:hypothetical protein [Pirellulales bacterium]
MQRTRIDEEIASIDAQLKALDEKSTWLERVLAARDPWQRRATLLAELKPLAGLPDLGDDALGTFENHARRTSLWHKRLRQVRRRTAKLRRTVDRQPVSDALVRQGPRVEALIEQRTWLKSIVDDVGRLEARIEAATKQLGDHRESLGLPRQVDAKRGFDPAVLDRIRPAYKALRSAQSRRLQARRASDAPVVDDGRAAEQMAKALKGRGDGDLHTAIEQAGTLVAKLRRRVQLDERLAEMSRQQGDLAGQGRALVEHQLLPLKLLMALGAVFVLGCVCILAGLLLPTTFVGPIGWGLVGLGIVSTVTALGVKFWFEHSAEVEFEGAQQRAAQLATQIEQAKAERDELDKQLPRGGGPLLTRLAAAEKEQTELEALLPLHAQQTSATRQQQSAQAHYKRCQADWQSAEQRWRQALSSAGLPATLSIKQVRALMSQRDVLEDLNREIVRHRDELAERRKALDSLTGRITQVATDAQLDLSGWQRAGASVASPLELLDRLEQLWKSEQQLQAQRLERQQRHLKLTKLARKASRAYQKHRTAAKALLDKAGVRTATKFRALVERSRQRAQLAERADAVATELERLFTGADAQRFHDEATNRGYPEIEREHLAVVEHR